MANSPDFTKIKKALRNKLFQRRKMLPGVIKVLEDRRAPAVVVAGPGTYASTTWAPFVLTHSAGADTALNITWAPGTFPTGELDLVFSYSSDTVTLDVTWDADGNPSTANQTDQFLIRVGTEAQRVEKLSVIAPNGTCSTEIVIPANVDWDGQVAPVPGTGRLKGTMNPQDILVTVELVGGSDTVSIGSAYQAWVATGDGSDLVVFGSQAFGATPVGGLAGGATIDLGRTSATDYDSVSTGDASDSISFNGNATILSWGGNDTIRGTNGASTRSSIWAGSGQDFVSLGSGDDTVFGDDDNDSILLGAGNNRAFGGRGNDSIYAGDGSDFISGDEGNDLIFGTSITLPTAAAQGDTLVGGDGSDTLYGGKESDSIVAGMGSDFVYGRGGQDTIYGGGGADWIQDGLSSTDRPSGSQLIYAGDGDDTIIGGAGSDTIDFGTGVDYLLYGNPSSGIKTDADNFLDGRINANIGGASSTVEKGTLGTDSLVSAPDYLAGTNLSDTVLLQNTRMSLVMGDGDNSVVALGSFDDQYITLGDGRDFVFADGGDDNVRSGGGDDTLIGGAGNDTLLGEDGDDFIVGDVTAVAGVATDVILPSLAFTDGGGLVSAGGLTLSSVTGDDSVLANWLVRVRASTVAGDDSIVAGAGDDIVLSGAGNDTVDGGVGSDIIFGGAGNDLLGGGALDTTPLAAPDGGDYIFGEKGNDTLLAGDRDRAVMGGDENGAILGDRDVAWFSDFTFGSFINLSGWFRNGPAYGLVSGVSYVVGSPHSDTIVGDALDNVIFGGDGDDSLVGNAGNDLLFGGSMPSGFDSIYSGGVAADKLLLFTTVNAADLDGNDTILGGDGDDCVNAGNGNNSIDGGDGNDSLSFGLGRDTVNGGVGNDTLLGFISSDTKQISQADTIIDTSGSNLVSIGFDATGVVLAPASVTSIRTNNSIVLGSGDDTLFGAYLGSRIVDGGGANSLQLSGWGDTVVLSGNQHGTSVLGGIGNDSVVFQASSGDVTVSLSGPSATDNDFIDAKLLTPTNDVSLRADYSPAGGAYLIAQTVVGTSKADFVVMSSNGSNGSISAGDGNDLVQLGFWVNGSSGVTSSNRGGTVYAGNGSDSIFTGILGLGGNGNFVTASGLSTRARDYVVYTGAAPLAGETLGDDTVGGDSVFLAGGADTVYIAELDFGVALSAQTRNSVWSGFGPDYVLAGRGNHSIVTGLDSGDSVLLRTTADGTPVYARDDGEYMGRNAQERLGDYVEFLSSDVDSVYLELGDGNDVVNGSLLDFATVQVFAGRGVDSVVLGDADNTVVAGSALVDDANPGQGFTLDTVITGSGNDSVVARSSDVGIGLFASVGSGDNVVRGTQNPDCVFAGSGGDLFDGLNGGTYAPNLTTIGTDQQGDYINLASPVFGPLVANGGDTVLDGYGDHTVITGEDDDVVDFGASYMGNVSVMTGAGDDSVLLGDGWRWEPVGMDQTLAVGGSGTVSLGDGNDTVTNVQNKQVESSPSKIFGEGGDDYIVMPVGVAGKADSLFGGDGNDYLNGVPGTDPRIFPATSVSTSNSVAVAGYFDGGEGSNTIQGTALTDTIVFGAGDSLTGLGNLIHNGAGQERIVGGIYNDTIIMFAAASVSVDSGAGDDVVIVTTASSATVDAGDGDDTVIVTSGTNASVDGGLGNDSLSVTAQTSATVQVGDGDNALTLSAGSLGYVLTGGGDNRMTVTTGGAFTFTGGIGADVMVVNSGAGVTLDLGAGDDVVTVTAGGTTRVDLGDGDDAATVFGGPGGSSVNTGATVIGGSGSDSISFHTQTVGLVDAGDGDDYVSVYGTGLATISLGSGDDEFWLPTIAGQGSTVATAGGKWIFGQDGDDLIVAGATLTGAGALNTESQTIDAGLGNDTVHAWGGADVIFLGSGQDIVLAGAGDDTVIAGSYLGTVPSGASTLYSASFDPADLGDTILGGGGNDLVFAGAGDDLIAADYVRLTAVSTRMVQIGSAAAASSLGFVDSVSVSNTILGGGGSDTIFGAAGDDLIITHGRFSDLKGMVGAGAPDIAQIQRATADFTAGSNQVNLIFGATSSSGPVGYVLAGPISGNGLVSPLGSQIRSVGGKTTGDGVYRMSAFQDGTQSVLAMSDAKAVSVVLVNVDGESLDTGSDFIFAQGGNDIVLGSSAGDVIDLGASSVVTALAPALSAVAPTSLSVDGVGSWNLGISVEGSDTLFSGLGSDTVLTFDTVSAGSGDLVSLGGGWDYVRTGRGDDSINLGNGVDSANVGNLALTGGGVDRVVGGLGSDTVFTYNTGAAALLWDTVTVSTGSSDVSLAAISKRNVSGMLMTGNGIQVGTVVSDSGTLSRTVGAVVPDATPPSVSVAGGGFMGPVASPMGVGVAGTDAVIRSSFWNIADASTDTGAGGDTVLTGGGADYIFTGAGAVDSLGSDFVDAGAGATYYSVLLAGDSVAVGADAAASLLSGNLVYTGGLGSDTIGAGALSDTVFTVMRSAGAVAADTLGDFISVGASADFVVTGAGDDVVLLGAQTAASTVSVVGLIGDSAMTGGGHDTIRGGNLNDSVVTAFVNEIAVSARGVFGGRYLYLTKSEALYSGIKVGDLVTGPFIPPNTRVATVSSEAVELTQELFHPVLSNLGDSLVNGFRDTVGTDDTVTFISTGATMAFGSFEANLRFWSVENALIDSAGDSIVVNGGSDFVISGTGDDTVDLSGGFDSGLSALSTLSVQAWADSIADSNSLGTGFDLREGVYTRGNYFLSAGGSDSILGGNFADTIVTYIFDAFSDTLGDTIRAGDDADFIQTGVGNDFILFGNLLRPRGGGDVFESSSRSYAFDLARSGLGDASGRGTYGNFISSGGGRDTISHGVIDEFYPERSDTATGGNLADTVMTFGGKSTDLPAVAAYWKRVRSQGIIPSLDYLNDLGGDSIESGGGGDYVFSGRGDDTIYLGGSARVDIGKVNRLNSGGGRDNITGGEGNDRVETFVGAEPSVDALGDIVDLRGGDDSVWLGVGNDFVQLGAGNDYAFISKGVDTVVCGDGDDEVQGNPDGVGTRGDSILGGAGADRIRLVSSGVASNAVVTLRLGDGDEHLSVNYRAFIDLGPGVLQSVDASKAPGSITVIGGFGADTVYGSRFADSLLMGDGNNYVVAGGGSDTIEVGSGSDTVFGDAGNDLIRFRAQTFGQSNGDRDDYLYGGDGDDTIYGGAGSDFISGGAGRDLLFGDLSTSRNMAQSGDGNDTILGGEGDDSMFGGGGNDFLDGGVGNDYLSGGAGSDILKGGAGNDTLLVDSATDSASGDSGRDWLLVPVRASKMSYSGIERLTKY